MLISTQSRRALLGFVLAASAAGTIAQAQSTAPGLPVPPPPGGGQGVVTINCCRCLGQESGAVSLNTGTAPWRVSSVISPVNSPTNSSPLMIPGAISNPHPNWGSALNPAKWLQPIASTTRNDAFPATGHVTYVLKIRVPNCTIKQRITLSGQLEADDKAVMFVNNAPVALTPLVPNTFASFGSLGTKNFSHVLSGPGVYTVRVEVDQLGGGPFGMVLRGTANGKCDDKLEKGKEDRAEECRDC